MKSRRSAPQVLKNMRYFVASAPQSRRSLDADCTRADRKCPLCVHCGAKGPQAAQCRCKAYQNPQSDPFDVSDKFNRLRAVAWRRTAAAATACCAGQRDQTGVRITSEHGVTRPCKLAS